MAQPVHPQADDCSSLPATSRHLQPRVLLVCTQVDALEARAGKKGHIRLRGTLPLNPAGAAPAHTTGPADAPAASADPAAAKHAGPAPQGLHLDVQGLELRARNLYTGAPQRCSAACRALSPVMICHPAKLGVHPATSASLTTTLTLTGAGCRPLRCLPGGAAQPVGPRRGGAGRLLSGHGRDVRAPPDCSRCVQPCRTPLIDDS